MSKWALHATSARQDYDSRPEGQRPASRWRPQCRGITWTLPSSCPENQSCDTWSSSSVALFYWAICPILRGIGCAFLRGAGCASNKLANRLAKGRSFKRRDPSTIHPQQGGLVRADYIFRGAPFFDSLLRHGEQPLARAILQRVGSRAVPSKIIKSNGTIQPISWLY